MVGVGELLASAALKQVAGMLGTAIWEAIASQLKLGDELQALKDTLDSIHEGMVKSEKRLMKDSDVRVWMRKLKAVAYDMEDMIMEFEGDILRNRDGSQNKNSTTEISIPMKLRLTMPGKLKDMKRRLENIDKLRRFDLMDTSSDDQDVIQMRATGPCLEEGIVGRDNDKAELMKLLQEECKHTIIPIYGFGGLGKTTLAQMAFDDRAIKRDFDIRVWVYVSPKFSNENIGRSIISQVDGQSNLYDLSSVQNCLDKVLGGKKYLVVLDDLWEENTSNLDQLKAMLKGGAPGSKIIVTTRSEQIAKRMNRDLPFKLDVLPYDDCLKLFKHKAFPNGSEGSSKFLEVGEKIIKKCGGVPLAVKSLGYRLVDMPLHKWEETLKSELWEGEYDPTAATSSTAVLPSLKISYYYMPYYLRPCFLYFSAFPKGSVVEKRDLIHRWIALGFVSNTYRGEEYLQELRQMSFLEATSTATSISAWYSKSNNPHDLLFKMHDLIHDLARSVALEEVAICDAIHGSSGAKKDICRYMLFSNFEDGDLKCKDMPLKARAVHFSECTGYQPSREAFSKTKWLRVLDMSSTQIVELPRSMRNLHHLQVLNLSENTRLVKLHSSSSICDFQKLRYLDIHGCSNLRELPDNIHILQDLEYFDLSGCTSLQKLPSRFGELQMLSFLDLSCSQLEKLPETFNQLESLEYLNLSFCSKLKHLHTLSFKRMKGLLYLNMSGCTWLKALPEFYGDNGGCLNLEILDLSDCDRLINLSESFARLNKLRFLNLFGCSRIQNIIHFLGKFVKLVYLNLSGVPLSGFDVIKDSEAPSSSTGHSSGYSGEDISLKRLNGVIKSMPHLEYMSAGGLSLFSKEGIYEEFLTLPDFVVSARSGGNSSNITLLMNILDSTHCELNIRCLEAVMSAEEAAMVELHRKHRLASLSLEWSSTEWYIPSEPTVKTLAVLQHLQPHRNLKHLAIKGYNHSTFPQWIMGIRYTLPNLVKLVLSDLVWCDHLPTPANLSSIEELEIRNMPRLKGACLASCKNLKRLSLVALASGFTLGFIEETSRDCQGIHEKESDHAEEPETSELARTRNGDSSQENRETEQAIKKGNNRKNEVVRFLPGFKRKEKMLDLSVSSPAPSATKETVPTLCCLKIEYCQGLKLYPSINCEEYFINESKVEFITDTGSSAPILARKVHFRNCSHPTALLQGVNIWIDELVIDCCWDKEFLYYHYGDGAAPRRPIFWSKKDGCLAGSLPGRAPSKQPRVCDKESLNLVIQKLKITNSAEPSLARSIARLLQDVNIRINELVIDGCDMNFLNWLIESKIYGSDIYGKGLYSDSNRFDICDKESNFFDAFDIFDKESDSDSSDFDIYDKKSLNFAIQKLKITNSEDFDLDCLPCIPSLQELEIGCINEIRWEVLLLRIPHIQYIKINEAIYVADFHLLHQNRDFGIIMELCLTNLQLLKKASDVDPGELGRYDQLRRLSLRWSRQPGDQTDTDDSAVLQSLQPHANLSALEIKGYQGATFCAWLSNVNLHLPTLVKIKLVDIPTCEHLPSLGQLANLEELHISNMSNIREVNCSFYQGKHLFQKLRKLHIDGMGNLEMWSTNLEPSAVYMPWNDDEQQLQVGKIFPRLQHLIIKRCPRLMLDSGFQGCLKRIIGSCSEAELSAGIFIGSSRFSRLEAETNIFGFSHGLELLRYSINLNNLTIKSNNDLTTLPETIKNCRTLRGLQILDCWNLSVLPDWLRDLTSLKELEVHAPKLQCLPDAIKDLTSLNTLTLKQCNYKLREHCSISGEDYDKIQHIKHHVQDGLEVSISSSSDIALLEKTTSDQLIELNVKDLQNLSISKARKINLVGKEELQLLSLEWNSECGMIDNVALENLQPHQNLRRLCIKNYPIDAGFPHWMQSLPNLLVSMELSNVKAGHLHIDHLQNLTDLHVSSFYLLDHIPLDKEEKTKGFGDAKDILRISSTRLHKKLRKVTMERVGKLLWESSCLSSENIFPGLDYFEIDSCWDVRFEPSIPKSARYIISGSKECTSLFQWPSFKQVMGRSTAASSSKMEIKYSDKLSVKLFYYGLLDSLQQFDNEELTIDTCTDSVPLPACVRAWKSLRKLEILNCHNMEILPNWLGDMASLRELKVETYRWMETLPPCIGRLTSLQTLALLKCTKEFKQRCSEGGDDWDKIKHIENLTVEEI